MSSREAIPSASTGASQRIEIITGHERRRHYTDDDKARLVGETVGPGQSVITVARRHGISASLLYRWRRAEFGVAQRARSAPRLIPVHVAGPTQPDAGPVATKQVQRLVEITLPNGCSVRVDQHVDSGALRRILAALRE
jgi:transposase